MPSRLVAPRALHVAARTLAVSIVLGSALAALTPVWAHAQDSTGTTPVGVVKEPTPEPRFTRYRALALGMVSAATWSQALGMPEAWDRTWQGYGNRLGDQLGFGASEEALRLGLEHATHWGRVTPPCEAARSGHRVAVRVQAATRCGWTSTFVAQNRAGARRPNLPLLGAVVAASVVSLAWRPERKNAHKGQLFVGTRVGIVIGATVLKRAVEAARH